MGESNYKYLFPFEKVPADSSILIYGAGMLGQEYFKQILITGYCRVVGFIDKNPDVYSDMKIPVLPPEGIKAMDFDYIVIALRGGFWLLEVKRTLHEQGVKEEQMVYVLERADANPAVFLPKTGDVESISYAFTRFEVTFSLYVSGGYGDLINQKRFVEELSHLVPSSKIDIYSVQNIEFLNWLYSDCDFVENIIQDLGYRYMSNQTKYSLSISMDGTVFLSVDHFSEKDFGVENTSFIRRISDLEKECADENLGHAIPKAIGFQRHIFRRENCYTWFNHGGIFEIDDWHIRVPMMQEYKKQYEAIGLDHYVTVNTGNGSCKDGRKVAKSWPVDRFQKTVEMFKQKYHTVSVIQIGGEHEEKLKTVDAYVLGKPFGLVAYVLKNSIFHLDIEGGLVHLASQLGTKCIVLFGPTYMEHFSYAENINIRKGNCQGCCGLYESVDRCARGMDEPECMYSITPEIVMDRINQYMDEWTVRQNHGYF